MLRLDTLPAAAARHGQVYFCQISAQCSLVGKEELRVLKCTSIKEGLGAEVVQHLGIATPQWRVMATPATAPKHPASETGADYSEMEALVQALQALSGRASEYSGVPGASGADDLLRDLREPPGTGVPLEPGDGGAPGDSAD